jgi:hypothetical protein
MYPVSLYSILTSPGRFVYDKEEDGKNQGIVRGQSPQNQRSCGENDGNLDGISNTVVIS